MIKVDAKQFFDAVSRAIPHVGYGDRPILQGVSLSVRDGVMRVASADGYVGFRTYLPVDGDLDDVVVEFKKKTFGQLKKEKGRLVLEIKDGMFFAGDVGFPIIDGVFPDFDSVWDSVPENRQSVTIAAADMIRYIAQCQAVHYERVSPHNTKTRKVRDFQIRITFQDDGIYLRTRNPEYGDVEIKIDDTPHKRKYTYRMNANFILKYAKTLPKGSNITISTAVPNLILRLPQFHGKPEVSMKVFPVLVNNDFLVMPMSPAWEMR